MVEGLDSVNLQSLEKLLLKNMYEEHKRYLWAGSLASAFMGLRATIPELAPEIILGGIPIYNIQRQGHAASDELLKYRSMGGVFLAHQKGGNRTFIFTVKAFGPFRLALIRVLEELQWKGKEDKGMVQDISEVNDILSYAGETDKLAKIDGQTTRSTNLITSYTAEYDEYLEEEYVYHKTIPIITDSKIYTNMYLETLVYREDVRLGMNCMEIRCAFRQYLPPTNVNIMEKQYYEDELQILYERDTKYKLFLQGKIDFSPEIKDIMEGKYGKIGTTQEMSQHEKYYYQTYISEEKMKNFKRKELALNVMWGSRTVFSEYIFKFDTLGKVQRDKYGIELSTLTFLAAEYASYLGLIK